LEEGAEVVPGLEALGAEPAREVPLDDALRTMDMHGLRSLKGREYIQIARLAAARPVPGAHSWAVWTEMLSNETVPFSPMRPTRSSAPGAGTLNQVVSSTSRIRVQIHP